MTYSCDGGRGGKAKSCGVDVEGLNEQALVFMYKECLPAVESDDS